MNGTLKVYACYHPKLGFLAFQNKKVNIYNPTYMSYSVALATKTPKFRSTFSVKWVADERVGKDFVVKGKVYKGSEIEVKTLSITWFAN